MTKLDLKGSVLMSVAYSGIFSFPLTFGEIQTRLLFFKDVSTRLLIQALRTLVQLKQIEFKNEHFFIGDPGIILERQKKLVISEQKIAEGQRLISLVGWMPWIRGMVISGSTAVNNAKPKDDLDWLIITSDHSLWLVRPILLLAATIFGKRRGRNGHHRDNSWCFNMFLTQSNLTLAKGNQSVYTAYEVCQARFLLSKAGVEEQFLRDNSWVEKILPTYFQARLAEAKLVKRSKDLGKSSALIKAINSWAYNIQFWYMSHHMTREKVTINWALFHPRDTRKSIYQRWLKLINLPYVKTRD